MPGLVSIYARAFAGLMFIYIMFQIVVPALAGFEDTGLVIMKQLGVSEENPYFKLYLQYRDLFWQYYTYMLIAAGLGFIVYIVVGGMKTERSELPI
ncbi:MAG: hypothetical protein NZ911_07170 [Sulfolobales archaeon]|nr:hypothetical protein [Sulfolobales archaeon]